VKKVTLENVTAESWEAMAELRLDSEQEKFLASNLYSSLNRRRHEETRIEIS
jgi:hypothetical protein